MKRIIIIFSIAMFASNVFSQDSLRYEWGIKGGLNTAREFDGDNYTDTRAGFVIGFFTEICIKEKFSIQPELVYSQQGGKTPSGNTDYTDVLDYINVPVIFKFYVYQRKLSLDAGPQLGYMVNAKSKYGSKTDDIYDKIDNKLDGAICLGASYKFNEKFDVALRGNVGVTKIVNSMENTNNVGQLTLAYRF